MDKNDSQDVDLENNDLSTDDVDTDNGADTSTSLEDRIKALEEQNAELQTKLKKQNRQLHTKPKTEKVDDSKNTIPSTDYGLLAYLNSEGIRHADDKALFEQYRENTGKKPEDIIASKHFQADLAEQRETRETLQSQPAKNNRGGGGATDEVSVWAGKVEAGKAKMADVPPNLTYQVIQKRIAMQEGGRLGSDFLSKIKAKQSK